MTDKEKDAVWRSLPESCQEKMREVYNDTHRLPKTEYDAGWNDGASSVLIRLFGAHNLTAEEKPRSKVGDRIVFCGRTAKITEVYPDNPDRVFVVFDDNGLGGVFGVEYIEPYTEQEPKSEPKHGEIVIPVKAEYDESIWLPYRMELAKEISPKVIAALSEGGVSSDFCDNVIDKVTTIVDGIVERLKGGVDNG